MIARYTRPEMGRIWSEENKFRQWLEVELAAAEALAEAARLLRQHASCDAARIDEIEREVILAVRKEAEGLLDEILEGAAK